MIEHSKIGYFRDQYPIIRLIHTVINALGGKAEFDDLVPPWATVDKKDQIPSAIIRDLAYAIKHKMIKASFLSTIFWRYGEQQVKEGIRGRTD